LQSMIYDVFLILGGGHEKNPLGEWIYIVFDS